MNRNLVSWVSSDKRVVHTLFRPTKILQYTSETHFWACKLVSCNRVLSSKSIKIYRNEFTLFETMYMYTSTGLLQYVHKHWIITALTNGTKLFLNVVLIQHWGGEGRQGSQWSCHIIHNVQIMNQDNVRILKVRKCIQQCVESTGGAEHENMEKTEEGVYKVLWSY